MDDLDELRSIVERLAALNPQAADECEWCYFCHEWSYKTDGARLPDGRQNVWREPHAEDCLWESAARAISP